jgi:AcrR family transcriptional regulator
VPLSQLHYYFGSKQGLLLALLEEENRRRLARQTRMYASDRPLWERYEQACDFLEDDLDSGFVRVLQEMIAEGWANEAIGDAVRALLGSWYDLLTEVATEAEERLGPLGPFTAREVATLIGNTFMGSEALILLGFDRDHLPIRTALRRIGVLIRNLEEGATDARP